MVTSALRYARDAIFITKYDQQHIHIHIIDSDYYLLIINQSIKFINIDMIVRIFNL